ncbi:MAG TPA: hotdog domain-containing protein [Aggregatilinea sp.]|jgi:predicted thioesterase|uniref:thioesterase family protein n=1 Tax=Aggregatilinea sp. TaxID=2806333 RepID=UPI002BB6BF1C|nr:hotdog domain-containing protein [Aggregatilinea sp.]HML22743.1 hotdog domain-containing protein [Aggregatilinea sp.]
MTTTADLTPGLTGEARVTVTAGLTARALGSGLVEVYSTPSLIALLEAAAVAALDGHLAEGQTSVGTHLDVSHLAATPVGMRVRAQATLREIDGRRLVFDVAAWDETEQIASGTHARFLVDAARFIQRAEAKARGTAES